MRCILYNHVTEVPQLKTILREGDEVTSNEDLKEMYGTQHDIVLWMKHSRKRPRSEKDNPSDGSSCKSGHSVYEGRCDKMAKVDKIIDKLVKKHQDAYSQEQYCVWALTTLMTVLLTSYFLKNGKKHVFNCISWKKVADEIGMYRPVR